MTGANGCTPQQRAKRASRFNGRNQPRDNVIAFSGGTAAPSAKIYGRCETFSPVYRQGMINACPCCGVTAWHVGRSTAECAGCGSPLPLVQPTRIGTSLK